MNSSNIGVFMKKIQALKRSRCFKCFFFHLARFCKLNINSRKYKSISQNYLLSETEVNGNANDINGDESQIAIITKCDLLAILKFCR